MPFQPMPQSKETPTRPPGAPPYPPDHDMTLCWPIVWAIQQPGQTSITLLREHGLKCLEHDRKAFDEWNARANGPAYKPVPAPWKFILERALRTRQFTPPVWHRHPFWTSPAAQAIHSEHFVHQSTIHPKLLAYTPDVHRGVLGIEVSIKPGRYLTKYFGHLLSPSEILDFAEYQAAGTMPSAWDDPAVWELGFASSRSQIKQIYTSGPSSCMAYSSKNFASSPVHPCEVYAAGDLAIAFLRNTTTSAIGARALCWPERKALSRVYPTPSAWTESKKLYSNEDDATAAQGALLRRLRDLGYDPRGSLTGARLLKLPLVGPNHASYSFVMPYLDGQQHIHDDGEFIRIGSDPTPEARSFLASQTNGVAQIIPADTKLCDYCNNESSAPGQVVLALHANGTPSRTHHYCHECIARYTVLCPTSNIRRHSSCRFTIRNGQRCAEDFAQAMFYESDLSHRTFDRRSDPSARVLVGDRVQQWALSEATTDAILRDDGCWYARSRPEAQSEPERAPASDEVESDLAQTISWVQRAAAQLSYDQARAEMEQHMEQHRTSTSNQRAYWQVDYQLASQFATLLNPRPPRTTP